MEEQPEPLRQSQRVSRPPVCYGIDKFTNTDNVTSHIAYQAIKIVEPNTIDDAFNSDHSQEWKKAADLEYDSLMENQTCRYYPYHSRYGVSPIFKVVDTIQLRRYVAVATASAQCILPKPACDTIDLAASTKIKWKIKGRDVVGCTVRKETLEGSNIGEFGKKPSVRQFLNHQCFPIQ